MKNIHLIPTDNYSQLVNSTSKYGGLFLSKYYSPMKDMGDSYQNIYITSDEEIKEGDWCLDIFLQAIFQANSFMGIKTKNTARKIILTTDQDLIKDGVQAIDDEFLEWFVKNPSCESVEVRKYHQRGDVSFKDRYRIIIPQEEPKQEDENYLDSFGVTKSEFETFREFNKQETLKEVAKSEAFEFSVDYKPWETDLDYREYAEYGFEKGFIEGTKWQVERMYSEEEVIELIKKAVYQKQNAWKVGELDKWFEQFKKK
jgi:hypothetical protein